MSPVHSSQSPPDRELVILASAPTGAYDGIQEYTQQLAYALEQQMTMNVALWNPRTEPIARAVDLMRQVNAERVSVIVQYNPFSFGRWGFAPWLPAKLWALKHRSRTGVKPTLGLMVHETFMPTTNWRTALMGAWQRMQLLAVRAVCDVTLTSITTWRSWMARQRPVRPTHHLPVSSNVPDMRELRITTREALGVDQGTIVLAAFGSNHPSRMMDHVVKAGESVANSGQRTVLLNLGFNVSGLNAGPDVPVITPGRLDAGEVAAHLAAADIFLAPFIDGVSTRRTTVMAALQHGLPVVGTDGPLTDDVLREAGCLILTPPRDVEAYARSARELARNADLRHSCAGQARDLFAGQFAWPVVSARLLEALAQVRDPACA